VRFVRFVILIRQVAAAVADWLFKPALGLLGVLQNVTLFGRNNNTMWSSLLKTQQLDLTVTEH